MLADRVDWEGDARDGKHGGDDIAGCHGGSPGVGGGEVHRHLVDGNRADQTQINLMIRVRVPSLTNEKTAVSLKHAFSVKHSGTQRLCIGIDG